MILLNKISINNFLSHKDTKIKFEHDCKIEISGKSGSGKSAIVEAIVWCLYGISRSENKNVIRNGESSACVEIELFDNKNNNYYKIERKINLKNKHDISVYERNDNEEYELIKENGIKAIQKYIESNILKSSYELFINSIIYPQDNSDSFVKQTASRRKDLLLEIINTDDYDQYLKVAKEKEREINNNIMTLSGMQSEIKKKLIDDGEEIKNEKLLLSEIEKNNNLKTIEETNYQILSDEKAKLIEKSINIKTTRNNICNLEKEEKSLSDELSKKENLIKSINISDENVLKIKDNVFKLKDKRNELSSLDIIYQAYLEWNKKMNYLISISPIKQDYQYQIDTLNKQIISIMNEKIDSCPEINKPCPIINKKNEERVTIIEQQINEFKEKKEEREKELSNHQVKLDSLGDCPNIDLVYRNKLLEEIRVLEPFENELTNLNNNINNKELLLKEKDNINTLIEKNKTELSILKESVIKEETEYNNSVVEIDKKIKESKDKISCCLSILNELLSKKIIIDSAKTSIEKNKERLEKINKEVSELSYKEECLNEIKIAFGQNGIRAIIIDYFIPIIEEKINDILEKLSDFKIRFYTQKSGSGKDTIIDGLFINIIDGFGREFDFNNYSGGEKMRIMFAIFEGMATIQRCGFRIFDESIVGLDSDTTESFTQVMMQFKNNIKQLLCVSHIQGVKDLFDDKIEIIKINGISKINNYVRI